MELLRASPRPNLDLRRAEFIIIPTSRRVNSIRVNFDYFFPPFSYFNYPDSPFLVLENCLAPRLFTERKTEPILGFVSRRLSLYRASYRFFFFLSFFLSFKCEFLMEMLINSSGRGGEERLQRVFDVSGVRKSVRKTQRCELKGNTG